MSRLVVSLLGPFQALLDENPLTGFRSDKTRALLAYLVVEQGRPHPRHLLAALLWPDYPEAAALTYLRSALSNLRRLCGDEALEHSGGAPFLLSTRTTIQINPSADVWVDTHALDALRAVTGTAEALEQAVALYRSEFLEGFALGDSSPYDEWLLLKREHYHRLIFAALQELAAQALDRRSYAIAEQYARGALALEAWDEIAHRQLMTALALAGKRGAALAQYSVCRTLLMQELGTEPARETTELYLHIRAGHLSAAVAPASSASSAPAYMLQQLSPFVARTQELAYLDTQLDRILSGTGRVIFVCGDAGSGKTALLHAFGRRATQRQVPIVVVDGKCNQVLGNGDTYLPFREALQMLASAGLLQPQGEQDAAPLPFAPAAKAVRANTPADQGDLYEKVTLLLQTVAARHPLILLLDDLQWADSGTLGLLFHLGRRLTGSRILVIGAYRPEDVAQPGVTSRHPLNTIIHELQRYSGENTIDLNHVESRAFIDSLLDVEPNQLGSDFRETLQRHTEGHALFTVELLQTMKERGALVQNAAGEWLERDVPNWAQLPPRVEAVIAERIERLPPLSRAYLEAASVQGESFSAEILARCVAVDESQLIWSLSDVLVRQHGLLYSELRPDLSPSGVQLLRYRFTHSLYQTYLYGRLDPAQRAFLHRRVAESLEALYAQAADELAVQLAWHYEQAGSVLRAVHYQRLAGDRSMRLSLCEDAISHYVRGLALLETIPASPARAEQELALQVALTAPLTIMRGWGGASARSAILRAYELCQAVGARTQLIETLFLLSTTHVGNLELAKAQQAGDSLLLLAQQEDEPNLLAAAHLALGQANLFGGGLIAARQHLEQAVSLFDARSSQSLTANAELDTGIFALTWLSHALLALGLPVQAADTARRALESAQELQQPRTLAFALLFAGALVDVQLDEIAAAQARVATVLKLSTEKDLALYRSIAVVYQGYLTARQGQPASGMAQMQQGLAAWQTLNASSGMIQHYVLFARVCLMAGNTEVGLATVEEGLAQVQRYGMHYNEAELWRMRGELLLQQGALANQAENCFERAIEIARRQQARLWELRATQCLCLLWLRQGRQAGALALLAAIYNWFDEGFACCDLQSSRGLLEQIAQASPPELTG